MTALLLKGATFPRIRMHWVIYFAILTDNRRMKQSSTLTFLRPAKSVYTEFNTGAKPSLLPEMETHLSHQK